MTPMQETAGPISTRRKAKVTPTASASMLVATARGSMDRGAEGAVHVLFPAPGLPDHVRSDQPQQEEGDPVVDSCDDLLKAHPQQIAQKRHQHLKAAEIDSCRHGVASP